VQQQVQKFDAWEQRRQARQAARLAAAVAAEEAMLPPKRSISAEQLASARARPKAFRQP
jgi:hypothetical protein